MKIRITLITLISILFSLHIYAESTNELLHRLDIVIAERAKYAAMKEGRINDYRRLAAITNNKMLKYRLYGKIFDEYRYYNTDSAFHYSTLKINLAQELNSSEKLCDSRLNLSDIFSLTGMFKEAVDILNSIKENSVPQYLIPYYYHLHKNIYGLMADYAVCENDKKKYNAFVVKYRDLLLSIKPKGTTEYAVIMSDKLIYEEKYDEALRLLNQEYVKLKKDDHNIAFLTYSLSQIYKARGDKENEKRYLVLSAISDLQSAVKEYVSLRELAILLYEQGDIDRAYQYLRCSLEDARACNARLRTVEISEILPIIDNAYQQEKESQKSKIYHYLVYISILSLILIGAIFVLYKQKCKLTTVRRNLNLANEELNELNKTLVGVNKEFQSSNEKLKQANDVLSEANTIKEEYIGRYMDQCSTYIEKIDAYRRKLYKIAASHDMEKLFEGIKSTAYIEQELKEFYSSFDNTFFRLFPNFVVDFNKLLNDEDKIYPKNDNELNTELRIYALIRLGITDSVKIAQFLRYSVTTIYNYRTRIRNKAKGEREKFEEKVMHIGF